MYKSVELTVEGRLLRGCVRTPDGKGPFPVAIFYHGFTVEKVGMMRLHELFARKCVENGIACVRFDFYGCGESDGDFSEMTLGQESEDAQAIFYWTQQQEFTDPEQIFVTGHSMGGLIATLIAPICQPKAVAIWAPALNMYYGAALRARTMQGPCGNGYDINGLVLSQRYLDEVRRMDFLALAKGYEKPVLIVHGAEDELVPVDCAYQYQDLYGEQCRIHIVAGANHQYSSVKWKNEVYETSIAFLRRHVAV